MEVYFVDAETGGLDPLSTDLLSVGVVEWRDGEITKTLEMRIFREVYRVSSRALQVNKIDLSSLNPNNCYTPYEAMTELIKFIGGGPDNLKTLAGHNVAFDIGFIKEQLFKTNHSNLNDYVSYRTIDTASILKTLYIAGKLPVDISKLNDAVEYFGIEYDKKERHTALCDAIITAKLFSKLLEIIRGNG